MAIVLSSTKQAAEISGLKFLVHGPAGAGKTTLCGTTGESTIIISAESGLLSLRHLDIPVIEVKTLEQLYEAYDYVANTEEGQAFKWICLDSISEIAEVVLNHEKKNAKDPRQAYGALAEKMTDLCTALRRKGYEWMVPCDADELWVTDGDPAYKVRDVVRQNDNVKDPQLDWNEQSPYLKLVVDQDRARALGLTPQG